jgi:hypothetical protein
MPGWLIRLRDIVWPAVLSVVLVVVAVFLAIVDPAAATLPIVLAVSAVALALLAQRA